MKVCAECGSRLSQPGEYPDRWIDELNLSPRAKNVITRAGIRSIRELTAYSALDIGDLRNAGRHTLADIQAGLARAGLSLAEDS